ncbi:MAG: zinc dependent phospholipase C family protein [Clostridia bacterium]|nr:zinc dependent phospholipase C family protein [Clostridia bacterium]
MKDTFEKTYGFVMKYMMAAANPFKKIIIQTECEIHKFINLQALEIIKNDNYIDAYSFFSDYIPQLNEGVTWADQNFKSSGHFYSPSKNKGLYGNNNALSLALDYYGKALRYWYEGDANTSTFYLGAAVHLVQDMTVPQHANIRLLDNHRQYENFIKRTYLSTPEFAVFKGGYYIENIEEAVKCNARNAIKIYSKLKEIQENEKRYYTITKFTLPLAQKTTAGCFIRYYKDIFKHAD